MRTVEEMFNLPNQLLKDGDVGIEVEMEGINLPDAPRGWRRDDDGSLKGAENAEYVMRRPVSADKVPELLGRLDKALKDNDAEVVDTVRAGIHVHINVQQLNELEIANFQTLYMVLEPLLIKYCGNGREGNLFCLRVQDAPWIVNALVRAVKTRNYLSLIDDDLRYSSMNVKALGQYGSLEFRAMRSTTDIDRIINWCEILLCLREAAKKFTDPKDIINSMSQDGIGAFINKVFGDKAVFVVNIHADYRTLVKIGMRYAQDFAFCIDWNELRVDPPEEEIHKYKGHRVEWEVPDGWPQGVPGPRGEPGMPREVRMVGAGRVRPQAERDDLEDIAAWNGEW